jgi:3-phenylpropionate/trans-cinnamate dioxygenase ferredoxin reductase subunit
VQQMASERVVIVGASVCGSHAAETLRDEGWDGEIVLVGAEPHLPYDRPPLSKSYLQAAPGEAPDDPTFNPESFYADKRIELELGRPVTAVDPGARTVTLSGGRALRYDRLLLATGSRVRRLAVPGADLPGVFYLRTLDDARRLREAIGAARRVVVVGAGFIGSEVAASCRSRGLEVTVLEAMPAPLSRALGEEVGGHLAALHRGHGCDLRLGTAVAAFQGAGRVEEVVTAAGERVGADLVLVGVGVDAETGYLAGSGIAVDNGVVVDARGRTNAPGVHAAGDCANWPHRPTGRRLRVEHWDHAWNHGEAAVRDLLGRGADYDPVLYFWSDQYDIEIQYLGHAARWDRIVLRGKPAEFNFAAFYLDGGVLRAAMTVGRPEEETEAVRELLRRQARPNPDALGDEGTELESLG